MCNRNVTVRIPGKMLGELMVVCKTLGITAGEVIRSAIESHIWNLKQDKDFLEKAEEAYRRRKELDKELFGDWLTP